MSDGLTEDIRPFAECFLCVWQCSGQCEAGGRVVEGETDKNKTKLALGSFQYALDMSLLSVKLNNT